MLSVTFPLLFIYLESGLSHLFRMKVLKLPLTFF